MNFFHTFFAVILALVCVDATIPRGNMPEEPTFQEVFNHLVELFENRDLESIPDCPYYVGMIISTLNKNFHSADRFKYRNILEELENAFYSFHTAAHWEHISSWEMMINVAITSSLSRGRPETMVFLNEALIKNNPLAPFGTLSDVRNFFNDDFGIVSVAVDYEDMVREAVMRELKSIRYARNERLRKAHLDDDEEIVSFTRTETNALLDLVYQHLRSLSYFDERVDSEIMPTVSRFVMEYPDSALDVYIKSLECDRDCGEELLEAAEGFI